jgi:uncharacterized SAM-binding protein YcdF (DUF218 family)
LLLLLLGAPVAADGSPGPALARRLCCALALLLRYPGARLLATGGVTPRAVCDRPEAVVAAAWLRSRGIAPERILVEPSARNTWENAAHSAALVRALTPAVGPLLLVTDPWHVPRARLAFRAHGLRVHAAGCRVPAQARRPPLLRLLLREGVGLCLYTLRWCWLGLRA